MTTRWEIGADEWSGVSKLVEETGEVLQVIGKMQATEGRAEHWDGSNLHRRLEEELGDLLAAIHFVVEHAPALLPEAINERKLAKQRLFNKWHADQQGRKDGRGS